ncbi:hypothetical protein [Streptomyces sp. NPDC058108]|uniref:hypothetical protein n=1 Tax=Streptomyces sp. NPDC058108 TaxID=3346344 RepID=UPI0036EC83FE
MSGVTYDPEAVARRIGPAAVEEADRSVAAAPPFSEEIRAKYRALFASVRIAEPPPRPQAGVAHDVSPRTHQGGTR